MAGTQAHGWVLALPVLLCWGKALTSSFTPGSKASPTGYSWPLVPTAVWEPTLPGRPQPAPPRCSPPALVCMSRLAFQVQKDLIQFGYISLELSSNLEPRLPLLSYLPSRVHLPAQFSLLLVSCVSENVSGAARGCDDRWDCVRVCACSGRPSCIFVPQPHSMSTTNVNMHGLQPTGM